MEHSHRKLNILVIADPHHPIPPNLYGGTERIVHLVCQGLQNQGHKVHLLAGEGSQSYGGKFIVHHAPTGQYSSRAFRKILFQLLSLYLFTTTKIDAIINFGRLDYLEFFFKTPIPLICRFANPVFQSQIDFVLKRQIDKQATKFIGISQNQVQHLTPAEQIEVIYNGVDIEKFDLAPQPMYPPYLAFLGRLTKNKGIDIAIEVAKQSGIFLKIAGNIPDEPGAKELFETVIQPELGLTCEWLGSVNDRQKNELLGGAIALLFPIQWSEPFGIVMIESLACGTPVIATPMGSVPEVITEGKTGFIGDSIDELVLAVKHISDINRYDCRYEVEEKFSSDIMVREYINMINLTINKR
jgi:glycosyltransferase involved in cell wall biosynthesis